jgi:hypothetical protein
MLSCSFFWWYFCIRLIRNPSAVSSGCQICTLPLLKLAKSFLATGLFLWKVSVLIVFVHKKERISLHKSWRSLLVDGSAMRSQCVMAELIKHSSMENINTRGCDKNALFDVFQVNLVEGFPEHCIHVLCKFQEKL